MTKPFKDGGEVPPLFMPPAPNTLKGRMERYEQFRLSAREKLEPDARAAPSIEEAYKASTAISLKRIADVVEEMLRNSQR